MAYVYMYIHTGGCLKHEKLVFMCVCVNPLYTAAYLPVLTFSLVLSILTFTMRLPIMVSFPSWYQLITEERESRMLNFPVLATLFSIL